MTKETMEVIDKRTQEMKDGWEQERQLKIAVAREVRSLVVDIPFGRLERRGRPPAAMDPLRRLAELDLLDEVAPPANRPEGRVAMELRTKGETGRLMCQERRMDGRRCRFPALQKHNMCWMHAKWRFNHGGELADPYP